MNRGNVKNFISSAINNICFPVYRSCELMAKQRFICTLKSQAQPGVIEKQFSWAYLINKRAPKLVYSINI